MSLIKLRSQWRKAYLVIKKMQNKSIFNIVVILRYTIDFIYIFPFF